GGARGGRPPPGAGGPLLGPAPRPAPGGGGAGADRPRAAPLPRLGPPGGRPVADPAPRRGRRRRLAPRPRLAADQGDGGAPGRHLRPAADPPRRLDRRRPGAPLLGHPAGAPGDSGDADRRQRLDRLPAALVRRPCRPGPARGLGGLGAGLRLSARHARLGPLARPGAPPLAALGLGEPDRGRRLAAAAPATARPGAAPQPAPMREETP